MQTNLSATHLLPRLRLHALNVLLHVLQQVPPQLWQPSGCQEALQLRQQGAVAARHHAWGQPKVALGELLHSRPAGRTLSKGLAKHKAPACP